MRRERGLRFALVQHPAGRPRHVDAAPELVQTRRDGADARRLRRTRLEAPHEQDWNFRIEEAGPPLLSDPNVADTRRVAAYRVQVVVRHEPPNNLAASNRRCGNPRRVELFQPLQGAPVFRVERRATRSAGDERLEQAAGRRWPPVVVTESVRLAVIPAFVEADGDDQRLRHHCSFVFAFVSSLARFLSNVTRWSSPTPNASAAERA